MKIFHVDMNSFFASCEQAENPAYLGKPLIVCGNPKERTGIVLAASYEAKAFGVKTAMLNHEALRLCPNAIFVPSRHRLYSQYSRKVMAILDDFTPIKEQASIDE
ncbi:MAG: DNA polymerase IV, partial [Clostridia bacterium]